MGPIKFRKDSPSKTFEKGRVTARPLDERIESTRAKQRPKAYIYPYLGGKR